MLKRGRAEGWLKQPIETLPRWANFHGVAFNQVEIGPLPGFEGRGSTVIATCELGGGKVGPLLVVPKELIISRQNIELHAKADGHLREVLEALGDFARVRWAYQNSHLVDTLTRIADDKRSNTRISASTSNYLLSRNERRWCPQPPD